MNNNFFKLNLNDAISSRRELLSSEINLIKAREHIKKIVILKKQKQIINNKLKEDMISLVQKMNSISHRFPKEKNTKENIVIKNKKHSKKETLEEELARIKSDLERLQKTI